MRTAPPVGRNYGPAVREGSNHRATLVDHWFDGKHETPLQLQALARLTVVGYLGLLVRPPADSMTHQVPHNAEPGCLGHLLDCVADIPQSFSDPGIGDPALQRGTSDLEKSLGLLVDLPDRKGDGRVGKPAV